MSEDLEREIIKRLCSIDNKNPNNIFETKAILDEYNLSEEDRLYILTKSTAELFFRAQKILERKLKIKRIWKQESRDKI